VSDRFEVFADAVHDCLGFLADYGFEGPTFEQRDFDARATFLADALAVRAVADWRDEAYGVEVVRRVRSLVPEPSAETYVAAVGELLAAAGMPDDRPPRPGLQKAICADAAALRRLDTLLRGDLGLLERALAARIEIW
jgi:hypothetical protein